MKKSITALVIALVLVSVIFTAVFACGDVIDSNLLPDSSKYVATASVWVRVYGETVTSELYHWTAFEIFWPGKDCFIDGFNTVKIDDLSRKSGYSWTLDGDEYCIVKN